MGVPARRKTQTPAACSDEDIQALDTVVDEYSLGKLAGLSPFQQGFMLAEGVEKLKDMITPEMMKPIMHLQGTALGFRTDKDKTGGYGEEVVKSAMIEATLRGVRPIGNEFNIIAERCYITREGATRLVREFDGLTNLALDFAVPRVVLGKGGAVVNATAKWNLGGKLHELTCEIPVRVNAGMGTDAILGKAERKLLVRVYKRLTGSITIPDGNAADMDVEQIEQQSEGRGASAVRQNLLPAEPKPAAQGGAEGEGRTEEASSSPPPVEESFEDAAPEAAPQSASRAGAPSRSELEKKVMAHCVEHDVDPPDWDKPIAKTLLASWVDDIDMDPTAMPWLEK